MLQFETLLVAADLRRPSAPSVSSRLNRADQPPAPGYKKLVLLRHGEAEHNVFESEWRKRGLPGDALLHPDCPLDPLLTPLGESQALSLHKASKGMVWGGVKPGLFVVSPLRRAAQTCLLGFSFLGPNTPSPPPWLASHLVCEESNGALCDRLSEPALLKSDALLAGVDYDTVYAKECDFEAENSRRHQDLLQSKVHLLRRCDAFLAFVKARPENVVVVATHSMWLQAFLGVTLNIETVEDRVPIFGNAELRAFDVQFK